MASRRQIRESKGSCSRGIPAWKTALGAAVAFSLLAPAPGAFSADRGPTIEYQVKAAFLLNFTKFIEWPSSESTADAAFTICILGEDPFGAVLDRMVEGESVSGRKLVIQRISRRQSHSCQVVFASRSERDLSRIIPGLGPGVLSVCEGENSLREGCMIAFVIQNRRVRFDVNHPAAVKGGLRISSKLMSVARSVEK